MREYRPARWQLCPGRKDNSQTQTSPVEPKATQPESEAYARTMSIQDNRYQITEPGLAQVAKDVNVEHLTNRCRVHE